MNFLSKTALATACALSLSLAASPANALTPEQKRRMVFSMASAASWGVVGAYSTLFSRYVYLTPGQEVWGNVMATVCGSVAAAAFNEWSPDKSVVSAQAVMVAMIKAGIVVGSSNFCRGITVGAVKWYYSTFMSNARRKNMEWVSGPVEVQTANVQAEFYAGRSNSRDYWYWDGLFYKNGCSVPTREKQVYCAQVTKYRSVAQNNYWKAYRGAQNALGVLAKHLEDEGDYAGVPLPDPRVREING